MPYFVYRVFSSRRLEKVDESPSFRDASTRAKALRANDDLPPDCTVRVVFAATELGAEILLSEVRAPKPGLADDE